MSPDGELEQKKFTGKCHLAQKLVGFFFFVKSANLVLCFFLLLLQFYYTKVCHLILSSKWTALIQHFPGGKKQRRSVDKPFAASYRGLKPHRGVRADLRQY